MAKTADVVLIGGEKGGTGKSTISTNLAVYLASAGRDVLILDADPQATASKWAERRIEAGPNLPKVNCAQKHGNIVNTVRDLATRYEFVIIDAGGRDSAELRSGMVVASRMYIPMRASQADLETLPTMSELITNVQALNPDLKTYAILSMAPSNPAIREVEDAQELLTAYPEIMLCDTIIRDRKVFRDAMLHGKGVVELANSLAKAEIQLLAQEVFP